jgi:ABC-type multidrug transport system fused ATPase/permease subunit
MLRYRLTVAGAVVMAFVSAGGLGAGLLGLQPVLQNILGDRKGLPDLARDLNEQAWVGGRIPESLIQSLPADPFAAVVWIMIGLGLLTVLGAVANFLHAYLSLTVVNRTTANIRREVFHRVLRLPLKDVVASGPSDTISRIVNDSNALATGFTAVLSRAVAHITKGLAGVIAAFILDWRLAAFAMLVAPVLAITIRKLGKRIRRASRKALDSQAGLYGAAAEALQGLRVVKVHSSERYEAGRFHRINKEVMRQMNRARTARALASPLVEVMAIFSLGVLVILAARIIMMQQLPPSELIVTLAALGIAGASLKPLTGVLNDVQAASAASDRLAELLRRAPEQGHDSSLPRLPRHRQSIAFRNVSFTYPAAMRRSLDHINLHIAHGERVAIVGPNGSGKSTLLALVPRLFDPDTPTKKDVGGNGELPGSVFIDGTDIRTVSIRSLRRQIGVVTQETVLFSGTIRSNIGYGAENASDEAIRDAARRARADEFIESLPQGYDTPVGEQGATLSGGQRQRIAIARAILRQPSILILDEATSMIDADSEAKIAEAINEFASGRTCLIVAHRLSTVVSADRIVVMESGRIIDQGSHAELLERCPTYRLIAEHQLVRSAPRTAPADEAVAR